MFMHLRWHLKKKRQQKKFTTYTKIGKFYTKCMLWLMFIQALTSLERHKTLVGATMPNFKRRCAFIDNVAKYTWKAEMNPFTTALKSSRVSFFGCLLAVQLVWRSGFKAVSFFQALIEPCIILHEVGFIIVGMRKVVYLYLVYTFFSFSFLAIKICGMCGYIITCWLIDVTNQLKLERKGACLTRWLTSWWVKYKTNF